MPRARFTARRLMAGVAGGILVRAVSGPDRMKPYLFIPDLVLSALLGGAAGLLAAWIWECHVAPDPPEPE